MKPEISIIVPIYNVASYLRKCLDSLRHQTMKEIEVICIDDGSTDRSGEIAEEYSKLDERFRVIRTNNRGLSSARNRGIDEAKAEWLMFVDSDDWVESGFCEIPYKAAMNDGSDLVIFGYFNVKNGRMHRNRAYSAGIISRENAIKQADSYAWNKLYKKKLFENIRYPVGRIYEDLATTHKLIYVSQQIHNLPHCLYFHTYRRDSISQLQSAENKREGFKSALYRSKDLKMLGCNKEAYWTALVAYALGYLAKSYSSDDSLYMKAEKIVDSTIGIPPELSWQKKIMLLSWKIDKRLFHRLCRITGLKDKSIRGKPL